MKPFGIKGEMVIFPLTDFPERFFELKSVWVTSSEDSKKYEIQSVKEKNNKIFLKLKGVETPEEVKKFSGSFLEIEKDEVFQLPPKHYYIFDLIGLSVFDIQGEQIGEIKEVISYPANDVYVVKTEKKDVEIPAIKEIVQEIDLKNKRMVIKLIEGLLE